MENEPYKFRIPDSVLAKQGKRIERDQSGIIEFEGTYAVYTKEERAFMRTLPRNEMSFIHALKAEFDAELVPEGPE